MIGCRRSTPNPFLMGGPYERVSNLAHSSTAKLDFSEALELKACDR